MSAPGVHRVLHSPNGRAHQVQRIIVRGPCAAHRVAWRLEAVDDGAVLASGHATASAAASASVVVVNASNLAAQLVGGAQYRAVVEAVGPSGLRSEAHALLLVDGSAPLAPPVGSVVGAGEEPRCARRGRAIRAAWPAFADAESGVARYMVSLGTSPGGTELSGWRDVSPPLALEADAGDMPATAQAQQVYVNVKAINHVGLGTVASSEALEVIGANECALCVA